MAKAKKGPTTKSIGEAATQMKERGRDRRELATRVGTYILNEIELGGACHIENYNVIHAKWAVQYFLGTRRRGKGLRRQT